MRTLPPVHVEAQLQRAELFRGLGATGLARIAQGARVVRCPRGASVFHQGECCTGVYLVAIGHVKVYLTSVQGAEKVVDIVQPGECFGEAMMFLEQPYPVSAEALTPCCLLHVSKAAVLAEMARDPASVREVLVSLARRTQGLLQDVEAYSLQTGRQRVVAYLLSRVAPEAQVDEAVMVVLPVSKQVIASRLNLTQEHFSRTLHELDAAGLIRLAGRRLAIPCVAGLRADLEGEGLSGPSKALRRCGRS